MATSIKSTDLDFDNIKSSLKTYFQSKAEFSDYDFEASGLSNILDVLAYNTHINGLIANFALNESYLNTAQIRSSIVSHAEALGYTPRSKTSARAVVNLSITISADDRPARVTLPANTSFSAEINDVTYTFETSEPYVATDDGDGTYTFLTSEGSDEITIIEGTRKTKTFLVGDTSDQQVYVIPDDTIDTTTLVVKVYESTLNLEDYLTYTNINTAVRIEANSTHYQIKEVPNGYYEIIFGDGSTLGKAPESGNKIEVTYLSNNGSDANAGDAFVADSKVTVDGVEYSLSVTTVTESAGGADKEDIESIRYNAPLLFASQQRMVTAQDYRAQILANYSQYLKDCIAWGGNDNVPPVYGRTYVSLNFIDGTTDATKQFVKDSIVTNLSNNLAVMSIDTVFADPITTYLELGTVFNFDPDQTSDTARTAENKVLDTIRTYFAANLNTYGTVFRRSNVLTEIDKISPAILNSRMTVKVQQRFVPTVNQVTSYQITFPVSLEAPNKETYTITSSKFVYLNSRCTFRNRLNSNVIQIIDVLGNIVSDNAGSYDADNGVVSILGVDIQDYEGVALLISAVPFNQSTVRPLRNYIISQDAARSTASAVIDRQNTLTTTY